MNKYYTAITVMIVFSMIVMLISLKSNIGLEKKRKQASAILFGLIIISVICEWSGNLLNGRDAMWIPLHICVKATELSLAPFIGLMCGRSFSDSRWEKTIFYILCVNVLFEIISAFTGIIYYVDEYNIYHHGSLYVIYLLAYILGISYFVGRGITIAKQFQGNYGLTILLTVLFVAASIITQMLDNEIKIDWLAISIAAVMLYKFYGDMLLQIDGLTGVLNHWGYEHTIRSIRGKAVLLFFDVDKFKEINDTYGHAVGDYCLKGVAACLQKAYGNYGMCFRYGGDEFCVIMTRSLNHAEDVTKEFYQELKLLQQKEQWMPDVSCGYACYNPKEDDIQETMKRADQLMYEYKEKHRTCDRVTR